MGLRLIGIGQSLWLDEAISANVAKNYSYSQIITEFSKSDFHPPLYYLTLKTWGSVFGFGVIELRLMSVLFCLITIFLVYKIAGENAAWLTSFNPLLIYYSQEARMYSMVTMLLIGGIYFLIKKKYILTSVFFGLSLLTFYGSIFLIVSVGLYLLVKKKFKEIAIISIGPLIGLIIIWPLLRNQLLVSKEMLGIVTNWDLVLGKANLKNLLMIPLKFTSGRISFYPKVLYYLISGLWMIWVFKNLFKKNIYGYIFWVSLIIGTIFSIFTPMLQYFRFLYLIPILAMMIENQKIKYGFLIFGLVYLLIPKFHREDWKGMVVELPKKVYMIKSFYDPVSFYNQNILIEDIRSEITEDEITVIPYGETIHGVDHQQILKNQKYRLTKINNYREITSEEWTKEK